MSEPSGLEVTVCENRTETEAAYAAAERENRIYLAIEAADGTWSVVYDLLPAQKRLDSQTQTQLRTAVTDTVEALVAETDSSTEVGHTIGSEMGSLYGFEQRQSAEAVAEEIRTVLEPLA
ncbi:MAG: hypothetical protein ABEJ35_02495 [Halobacteriaceae archaeon]